jgi:pimeloyl-ACP methyl ester carboxylesterase
MASVTVDQTRVNGADIAVRSVGDGPPLLFLPGAGATADLFAGGAPAAFITELAKSYRVLVPEHPGFGDAERPGWVDNIHDMAYAYLDLLDALDLQGVHLVGQSLGGWMALELAVRNTRRLASLTVCGAAGVQVRGAPKGDLFLWNKADFAGNMFWDPKTAEAFLGGERTPQQVRTAMQGNETLALLAWEPRLVDPDLHKWLHRIDVPTHVIWAEDDRVLPQVYGQTIASLIAGARFTVIPNTRHLLHLDQPKAFSDAVDGFIRETAS